MSRPLSIYLDVVRFGAAFLVLLSHLAYSRFTGGGYSFLREYNQGSDAVVLFFVLSGLVIAYTTDAKRGVASGDSNSGQNGDMSLYVVSRFSRLYSVALPAIVLGLLLDAWGNAIDPRAYDGWWHAGDRPVWRAITSLLFANELWGNGVRPGTNGPYWSVTYEFWYYLLFAAAMFLHGRRRVIWIGAIALIAGPKVLLLLPAWLLGVWVWRMISRDDPGISTWTAWALAIAGPSLYVFWQAADVPRILTAISIDTFGRDFIKLYLRFSDEFIWNNLLAVLVAAHFLGMAVLVRHARAPGPRVEKILRWPSGFAFSIYLFHYPLIMFFMVALDLDRFSVTSHIALLTCTVVACFLLGAITEKRKGPYDRFFRWLAARFGIAAKPTTGGKNATVL